MATVRLHRDSKSGKITIQFCNRTGQAARYTLPIKVAPEQWDADHQRVVAHPNKDHINTHITALVNRSQIEILKLKEEEPISGLTSYELRDKICAVLFHEKIYRDKRRTFISVFDEFTAIKQARTRECYLSCRSRLYAYDDCIDALYLEEITPKWLQSFSLFCSRTMSQNTINIRLRCIRAVFNYALTCEYTQYYPFRRVKIKNTDIIHHDIATPDLITFLTALDIPPACRVQVDMCRLIFFLISPNAKDLHALTPASIEGNRIKYLRAKTHKAYSIRIQPEARLLIEKYKGTNRLLAPAEKFATDREFLKWLNKGITLACAHWHIPRFTTNWLRHGWSTYAFNECNIPADIISQALGHSFVHRTTQTYINLNALNPDAANRCVLDKLFNF